MLSTKHAKHAKPVFHPTRSHLSAGLTAALLPLCLAAPALADSAPLPVSAAVADATGMTGAALSSADQPGASTPTEAPSPEAARPTDDGPSDAATPAGAPAPAAPAAEAQHVVPAQAKRSTTLRISGPSGAVAAGKHTIAVRLLADNQPVKNGYVRIERWTSTGWTYAGRMLTRADGLGSGKYSFTHSTKVRARYEGSALRTPDTSNELPIDVEAAAADFRRQALKVAATLNGRPYRFGSTGPSSFDCSGFTGFVYRQVGKSLPRTSGQQRRATVSVPKSAAVPGDLIFMSSGGRVGHVGIYAGGGKMWDAPSSGGRVSLRRIYTSNYTVGRIG